MQESTAAGLESYWFLNQIYYEIQFDDDKIYFIFDFEIH